MVGLDIGKVSLMSPVLVDVITRFWLSAMVMTSPRIRTIGLLKINGERVLENMDISG